MMISLAAEPLFYIGTLPITNTTIVTLFISAIIVVTSYFFGNNLKIIPRGFQNVGEYALEAILNLVDSVTQDKRQTKKFFPLIATIFVFVVISNWVEIIPGLGTVGIKEIHHGKEVIVPFLRSNSADLNMTLALALISFFSVQFMGIMAIGVVKYASKFFISPFRKPYVIGTFVGILELIGEVAKIVSFSFRLFGNIFAGEVLLLVMLTLVPLIIPVPFLILEIFVGFIQALVFAMLTLVFLKIAVTEPAH